jgi:hypothetical protein
MEDLIMTDFFFNLTKDFHSNVFFCSQVSNREDGFTRSWEYFLNNNNEIAQSITDYVAESSGRLEPSEFVEAIDQSRFSFKHHAGMQPDLVLLCKKYCIVCEHKLSSVQGNDQLPTYLKFRHPEKPLFVIYITNRTDEIIDESILLCQNYLKPKDSFYNYYLWKNFYPFVKNHSGKLAEDFIEFMELLKMKPLNFNGWGDIFKDQKEMKNFEHALEPIKYYLVEELKAIPLLKNLSLQIRVPKRMRIQVIHLFAAESSGYMDIELNEPRLFFQLKRNVQNIEQIKNLADISGEIDNNLGQISVRTLKNFKPDSNGLIILREYSIELKNILVKDMPRTQENIKAFSRKCLQHLETSDSNVFK